MERHPFNRELLPEPTGRHGNIMTENNQKQLGKTLWAIADQLRGAMNADDFRDYMLAFLFLRYLSDNYEQAAKKELGRDYPDPNAIGNGGRSAAVGLVRAEPRRRGGVREADAAQGALRHQARAPLGQHRPHGPHPERRAAQHAAGGLQVHRERVVPEHVLRACSRRSISARTSWARPTRTATPSSARSSRKIAEGLAEFSTDSDTLGDAYEYLIGQFAAGSGKKAGEFYTPQRISDILSAIVTLDSQEPKTGKRKQLDSVLDFACGSGSLLLNVRKRMGPHGIGKIFGQEKNITTYNLARMNMLLHGVKDTEFEIYHGDTLTNDWDMLRETNPAKKPKFDAVVANPPFSYRWEPNEAMGEDVRFKNYGAGPEVARPTSRSCCTGSTT